MAGVKVDSGGVFCGKISSCSPLGSTARLFTWLEPEGSTYCCTNWRFTLLPATAVTVGAVLGVVGPPPAPGTSRSRARAVTGSPTYRSHIPPTGPATHHEYPGEPTA